MTSSIEKIGASLEAGTIPEELAALREFGSAMKSNPEQYRLLREKLKQAKNETEQLALLNNMVVSEAGLRTMTANFGANAALGPTVTITITITITTWPNTAH